MPKKSGVYYLVTVLTEGTSKSSPSDERSKRAGWYLTRSGDK